jgi:hypothetical protein
MREKSREKVGKIGIPLSCPTRPQGVVAQSLQAVPKFTLSRAVRGAMRWADVLRSTAMKKRGVYVGEEQQGEIEVSASKPGVC